MMFRNLRLATSTVSVAAASVVALAAPMVVPVVSAPQARADALPASPSDDTWRDQWVNPELRTVDSNAAVTFEVTHVDSQVALGAAVELSLTVTNNSADMLSAGSVSIAARNAAAVADVASARTVLAGDSGAFGSSALVGRIDSSLAPGESTQVKVQVPVSSTTADGLRISQPGIYPVWVGLTTASGEQFSSQRFLLNVKDPHAEAVPRSASPLSIVAPVTADVDIVGGETGEAPERAPLILRSEQLAESMRAGGKLAELVDALSVATDNEALRRATCVALDPQLIDVASRMSNGYSVGDSRPSSVSDKRRLRDSWSQDDTKASLTPGQGVQDAAQWLDKVRALARNTCIVAMPWANADLDAVAKTNNPWLMREAVQRGSAVLEDVVGVQPEPNIVIPGSGYVSPDAAKSLGWADQSQGTGGDINAAWEASTQGPSPVDASPNTPDSQASLDSVNSSAPTATAPTPSVPVSVLVADNTVWQVPQSGRFGMLAPGIRSVTYQGSLAATLAQATTHPITVGYGNEAARFDYSLDSAATRSATAASAVTLAVAANRQELPSPAAEAVDTGDDTLEQSHEVSADPLLMMLPAGQSQPRAWLESAAAALDSHAAVPMTLKDYVSTSAQQEEELGARARDFSNGQAAGFGAPYSDPTVVSDTEILRVRQQSDYTNDLTRLMVSDPAIAVTPYNFTAPLRQDLLRAIGMTTRRSMATFDKSVTDSHTIANENRDTLTELRSSVTLLPPGNVYTRFSDSSPLLIAAKNGLPLPVDARIRFTGPQGASLKLDDHVVIPAKGSITLQMTANLPSDDSRTYLKLWLATPSGAAISNPVDIGVQTRRGLLSTGGAVSAAILVLFAFLFLRFFKKKRREAQELAQVEPEEAEVTGSSSAHVPQPSRHRQQHRLSDDSP